MEDVFKALSDPTRLKILRMLAENGEMCVCKIVDELDMGQPAVSHHMAALRHAGLVHHRKSGQWIHYSLDLDALREGPLAHLQELVGLAAERRVVPTAPTEDNCCAEETMLLSRGRR